MGDAEPQSAAPDFRTWGSMTRSPVARRAGVVGNERRTALRASHRRARNQRMQQKQWNEPAHPGDRDPP